MSVESSLEIRVSSVAERDWRSDCAASMRVWTPPVSAMAEMMRLPLSVSPAWVALTALVSPLFNLSRRAINCVMNVSMPWLVAPVVEGATWEPADRGMEVWLLLPPYVTPVIRPSSGSRATVKGALSTAVPAKR